MARMNVGIKLAEDLVLYIDQLVSVGRFKDRRNFIEDAIREKLARLRGARLARECVKLDPVVEQAEAGEGLAADLAQWPEDQVALSPADKVL